MITKDKTGDRLVASIRRTRAGSEKPTEVAAPVEEPSRRSATPRKATAAAKKGAAKSAKQRAPKQAGGVQDNYQSGGRVWPD
ncbi:MAG: hypothetical protein ACU85V_08445 [Gammaproteobacteria bacterium]